jgi:hypothetical protein
MARVVRTHNPETPCAHADCGAPYSEHYATDEGCPNGAGKLFVSANLEPKRASGSFLDGEVLLLQQITATLLRGARPADLEVFKRSPFFKGLCTKIGGLRAQLDRNAAKIASTKTPETTR